MKQLESDRSEFRLRVCNENGSALRSTASVDQETVEAELIAGGKVCDTCRGTFVAVKEGHPAYHRW